jgi:hypothetical protein
MLAVAGGILGIVAWAAKRVVGDVHDIATDVKALSAWRGEAVGQIAELQKGQGRLEARDDAQQGRIDGGLSNHGERIAKLETQMVIALERRP